jgi:hypothetical protein
MDYPKFDKNAKISMVMICHNFVGALSSFLLFKEPLGNLKQLIHMGHQAYEYGIYSNAQLHSFKIESKLMDKLLLIYTPERTQGKTVYDCVEMRDGELMINSGVCNQGGTTQGSGAFKYNNLFKVGGLNSLLPMLELIKGITQFSSKEGLDSTVNDFLRLLMNAL